MEVKKKKIKAYKTVCVINETREETAETVIPDASPDLTKVISVFAVPTLNEKSVMPGGVRAGGRIDATVFYEADGSEKYYELKTSFPFSQSFETVGAKPEDKLILSYKTTYEDCEVINSRKVRLKVRTAISAKLMRETELCISESVEDGEEYGINTLVKPAAQTVCADCNVKQIYFTEEIRMTDENVAKDSRLIRWESDFISKEVKVSDGKILIRCVSEITPVFADKDFKRFYKTSYSVPFSQTVECDATEDDLTDVSIEQSRCYLSLKENEEGALVLSCELGASLSVTAFREEVFEVLCDAYSTVYECECVTEKYERLSDIKLFSENTTKEFAVNYGEDTVNVADCFFSACISGQDDSFVNCSVYIITEDGAGELHRLVAASDVKTSLPDGYIPGSARVKEKKITVTNDAGGMKVSLTVCVSGETSEKGDFIQVTDIKTDTSSPRVKNANGNLVVKRLGQGETVWDAAKKYGTTKNAVLNANGLLSDDVLPDSLILIPLVK